MNQKKQLKECGNIFFIPILLILAVIPLITNVHIYDNGLSKELWASANGQVADFFLYYKSHVLMILGLCVAILLTYWLCTGESGRLFEEKAWIPLIPAVGFCTVFSFLSIGS